MKTKKTKTTATATKFVPTKFTKGLTPEKFELIFKLYTAMLPESQGHADLMEDFKSLKDQFVKEPNAVANSAMKAFLKNFYSAQEGATMTHVDIFFAFIGGALLTYGICNEEITAQGIEALFEKNQEFWKMFSAGIPLDVCEYLASNGVKAQIRRRTVTGTDTSMKQSSDAATTTPALDKGLN